MKTEIPIFSLRRGRSPLIVSIPHSGTHIPEWLYPRLSDTGRKLVDTDWHLEKLYDFLGDLDATVLVATHSRYVVDLNRPSDDSSIYPGLSTTGVCPVDTFDCRPIYKQGSEPDVLELSNRIALYWHPYHQALETELSRLKETHRSVALWDAHSIRSYVPRFFTGELPQLNIGTNDGRTCDYRLVDRLVNIIRHTQEYSWVVNDRFKGGYITRHYGRPDSGIHALQLEMAMRTYMDEAHTDQFDRAFAKPARSLLRAMLKSLLE